jgi:hypothetical protein
MPRPYHGKWKIGPVNDGEGAGFAHFFLVGMERFQSVITAEHHRNPNVCKTLVSEAIRRTDDQSARFVMVADEAYYAGAIYKAMGFRQQARVASLCQAPCSST